MLQASLSKYQDVTADLEKNKIMEKNRTPPKNFFNLIVKNINPFYRNINK